MVTQCAARNDHLEMLQWAITNGAVWTDKIAEICAANGSRSGSSQEDRSVSDSDNSRGTGKGAGGLTMLQWARAQVPPVPWNAQVCSIAAGNGDLRMLQWLRSQNPPCPWDKFCCIKATAKGFLEVLQVCECVCVCSPA